MDIAEKTDLVFRVRKHLMDLAPHSKEREQARLMEELLAAHERLRAAAHEAWACDRFGPLDSFFDA